MMYADVVMEKALKLNNHRAQSENLWKKSLIQLKKLMAIKTTLT